MEIKVAVTNRKAYHNYTILETFEAGLVLAGNEVKSLREGKASIAEGFVQISGGEAYLENVNIPPYAKQSSHVIDYEPAHKRKLLLHSKEIERLYSGTQEKGFTVVPLEIYFSSRGFAKVKLGLAKGKREFDKREAIAKKETDRNIRRELKKF